MTMRPVTVPTRNRARAWCWRSFAIAALCCTTTACASSTPQQGGCTKDTDCAAGRICTADGRCAGESSGPAATASAPANSAADAGASCGSCPAPTPFCARKDGAWICSECAGPASAGTSDATGDGYCRSSGHCVARPGSSSSLSCEFSPKCWSEANQTGYFCYCNSNSDSCEFARY